MKFPLPRNALPAVELTEDQEEQYERLANSLIRDTLAEYDAFVVEASRRVDPARWKLVKRRDEVAIYRERAAGALAGRALSTPAMSLRGGDRDSFGGSLASSAGFRSQRSAQSQAQSLAQTIRMPPDSARGASHDRFSLSSSDSLGHERHSLDGGIFARTIGFPSNAVPSPLSAYSDQHYGTASASSASSSLSRFSVSSRAHVDGKLPRLLAVGTLRGSLDDVMYGIVSPNAPTVRLRTSYLDDDIADCAVLTELIAPTTAEPFRFLGIKWLVKESRRASAFVWPRDFVVLEHSGVMIRPDGARIGFHLMHSVDIPACRELTDRHILRAKLSSCYIYEEKHNGRVDVYMSARVEPRGMVMERMALRSAARALSSCWKSVKCAQNKKLAYYLQNERHSQLPTPARVDAADGLPVLDAAHNGRNCGVCHQKFGVLNRVVVCQLCCEQICYRCRIVRKLSSQLLDTMVTKTAVVFCKKCITNVSDESALEIASKELWDTRGGGRARSSSASSYLSGRDSHRSARSHRSRADSFSSEKDTYTSVVLGQRTSTDLASRRSATSSVLSSSQHSDRQPTLSRQSSLGSNFRGSAARMKRVSYSMNGPLSHNTGSTDTLSIADLDGMDAADDRRSLAMANADDPVMLDDSLTKIQHVDFVDGPGGGAGDDSDDDDEPSILASPRRTQPALVRLYDDGLSASPPIQARRTVAKDTPEVDFEFRMSELAPKPQGEDQAGSPRTQSTSNSDDERVVEAEVVEVEDAIQLTSPAARAPAFLADAELDAGSAAGAPRFRAQTTAAAPTSSGGGSGSGSAYQSQLLMQMNSLRDAVESTYQVAKANTELAKATVAERPFRTYSQFGFNVVGLRPARAMTAAAAPKAP